MESLRQECGNVTVVNTPGARIKSTHMVIVEDRSLWVDVLERVDKIKKYIVLHKKGEVNSDYGWFLRENPTWEVLNEDKDTVVIRKRPIDGPYTDYQIGSLIRAINAVHPKAEGAVVEIGCWTGKSTSAIANKVWPDRLLAVDTWRGNIDEGLVTGKIHPTVRDAQKKDIYAIFNRNMQSHTLGNIDPQRMDCFEFLASFDKPIKFCHIDASHDYRSVKGTIDMLMPKMAKGGVVCGDDIASANKGRKDLEGGVERAVIECLPGYKRDKNFWWYFT